MNQNHWHYYVNIWRDEIIGASRCSIGLKFYFLRYSAGQFQMAVESISFHDIILKYPDPLPLYGRIPGNSRNFQWKFLINFLYPRVPIPHATLPIPPRPPLIQPTVLLTIKLQTDFSPKCIFNSIRHLLLPHPHPFICKTSTCRGSLPSNVLKSLLHKLTASLYSLDF